MPKISIIIPVYKAENYLHRCVDSILAQTFTDFEILLVDDGSPDKSGMICDEYATIDNRVRVVHKENGGVSSARNVGLDLAIGEYIWFVDSDDWIESNALEILLKGGSNTDVCFFLLKPYPEGRLPFSFDSILIDQQQVYFSGIKSCGKTIAMIEQCGGFGWTCNKLFKSNIIHKHNLRFDHRFAIQEDHLFTLSYVIHIESISVLADAPYNYFMQEGSLFSKVYPYYNNKERNKAMYESRVAVCEHFGISDEKYIAWLTSDYATRMVANLSQLKRSNVAYENRILEIKEVNSFLSKYPTQLCGRVRYYRYIKWLPLRVLAKLL